MEIYQKAGISGNFRLWYVPVNTPSDSPDAKYRRPDALTRRATPHGSPVCAVLAPGSLSEGQRKTLFEWKEKLEALIARRVACGVRTSNRELETHLRSAIVGSLRVVGETCAPLKSALLAAASAGVAQYFGRAGDARQAAATFPALVEFKKFLEGDPLESSLDALARQAQCTADLIGRILAGGEVWKFEAGKESQS